MVENRNLILAIVLSVAILFGFDLVYSYFYPRPDLPTPAPQGQVTPGAPAEPGSPPAPGAPPAPRRDQSALPDVATPDALTPAPSGVTTVSEAINSRERALAATPRVRIDTPRLHGSISLVGGRLDDLTLANYHATVDPTSPEIILLSPQGSVDAYYAKVGWNDGGAGIALPGEDDQWTADHDTLTQDQPVTLSWDNGQGLTFKRTFALASDYLFTITQRVENAGDTAVNLHPYALVARFGMPQVTGFYILHEGPIGVFDGTLKEVDYDDLEEAGVIQQRTTGGWIGITDKYWLTAVIPDQQANVLTRFVHHRSNDRNAYQTDYIADAMTVPPGGSVTWDTRIFAGAKEVQLLDQYREQFGIAGFDRAIDFGWFYFLTKPIFYFLIYIREYVGNFGVAILILTVAIKLVFFPLANKSYKAMSQMRKLQPEMLKLRERFGDDKMRLNQEMMALYKREKVSPASGCLPMLVQIPVFFALYKVLFVTIEMRHAPFFGWVQDLSARDPTTIFNLFGIIPWNPPDMLMIGAWPLIMGITMFLQQKLNPQPPDPLQAKIFMALPVVFTIMLAPFPAGLVIYWTWNNILSILQQWVIMRRMGVKNPITS
ncbi:MAG: membrane protein insertase YidC [Rhodospirillales bacterium]|nr:membrane protein insertase YidC [Rhodospirillales bacterium]